ncbi:MAG: hypothetical protein GTO40_01415 [Deltaproteobacteria bacterium]|nr:hypothetical protein [Deltaproteobacteria bacterium]
MRTIKTGINYAVATVLATAFVFLAQPAVSHAFTEGKTIRVLVFATPGGGYDYYSRLVAQHISKYLPGNPKVLVQNMPIGYMAANTLWIAKPNGLTWGVLSREGYLNNIAGEKAQKYDFRKGIPIGSAADENALLYIRNDSGMPTLKKLMAEVKRGKKPPIMGGTTRSGTSFVMGEVLEHFEPGIKFKQVLGYPGGSEVDLALRKGEIQAAGRSKISFFARMSDMLKAGQISVLVQTGTVDGKRDPDFENVPALAEYAKTKEHKQLLTLVLLNTLVARPFWLPPRVPQDRVTLLQDAFRKTMADPELLAQAKKARRPITPVFGDRVEELYKEAFAAPDKVKAQVRKILGK